jgi:diguanylate cyclase (GGDEF)-like protein
METQDTIAAKWKSNWPYTLVLIPIVAAWICDRCAASNMGSEIVNVLSAVLTLALVVILQSQRRQLEGVSITDKLTGVFNSRSLRSELDREVVLSRRTRIPLSLIFLDVDDMKSVNDRYGHMAGNSILRQLGKGLVAQTREHMDRCFRFGGDEFVVLCPHADLQIAAAIAKRVHGIPDGFEALKNMKITLSLGLIQLREAESPDDFLKRADRAMYSIKQNGKNGIGFDAEDRRVPALAAHEQ